MEGVCEQIAGSRSDFQLAADVSGDKAPNLVAINGNNTIGVLLNTASTDFSGSCASPF